MHDFWAHPRTSTTVRTGTTCYVHCARLQAAMPPFFLVASAAEADADARKAAPRNEWQNERQNRPRASTPP